MRAIPKEGSMHFEVKHKRRSQSRAFNFPLYFQNSKLDGGFRRVLEKYFMR